VSAGRASAQHARTAVEATWRRLEETRAGRYAVALIDMRVVDRALALASKLFVAILPLSILSSALVARKAFGDQIVVRLRLTGGGAQATRALFASPKQVQSAAGLLGLVILIWSVLSFARALERVYLDCWGLRPVRAAMRARLVWLAGFCFYMAFATPLHTVLASVSAPGLTGIGSAVVGGLLFLWTPYILLGRRIAWRRLLPTAAISGAAVLAFGVGSVIFMPGIVTHDAQRYGYIGVAFAIVTWLFCFAAVIIAAAVLGALVDQWRRGLPGAVASSERDDASEPLRA
jgi:membrane protein